MIDFCSKKLRVFLTRTESSQSKKPTRKQRPGRMFYCTLYWMLRHISELYFAFSLFYQQIELTTTMV